MVVHKVLRASLLPKVLDRVGPQYVAHEPGRWWLKETVQLHTYFHHNVGKNKEGRADFTNVVDGVQLGRQPTVYAEELFVHDCGKRQGAEGLDARLVDALGVLVLAFELECEVVGQMPALVIPTEEEE